MDQLEFCKIECERQGTDKEVEMAVALSRAKLLRKVRPSPSILCMLARIIEPTVNERGFRITPVTFANGGEGVKAEHISRLITNLCNGWDDLDPQEVFQEFERIHPFADGNGRLGQILFNWRNGTLHDPIFAEEYIDTARK